MKTISESYDDVGCSNCTHESPEEVKHSEWVEWLTNNLRIDVDVSPIFDYYGGKDQMIEVTLYAGDKVVSKVQRTIYVS